jgi:hypothetical protein
VYVYMCVCVHVCVYVCVCIIPVRGSRPWNPILSQCGPTIGHCEEENSTVIPLDVPSSDSEESRDVKVWKIFRMTFKSCGLEGS